MTDTYTETEARWADLQLPRLEASVVVLSAWTSDAEIAAQAAWVTPAYGNEYETDTQMRLFRSRLRAAALAPTEARRDEVLIRRVLDGGVDELVTASTTDADLDTIVTAAEAGYGKPIPGLRRELELLREAEREDATA